MAKISARGNSKVAQHSIHWLDTDGWEHKIRLALRSDGRVLRAHDLLNTRPDWGEPRWMRGGYGIIAGVKIDATTAALDAYASRYFRAMHATMRNVEVLNDTTI